MRKNQYDKGDEEEQEEEEEEEDRRRISKINVTLKRIFQISFHGDFVC